MPAKNAIKLYIENGYYHIYNRGVAKNAIFLNEQDYSVFLHYLKDYLSEPRQMLQEDLATTKTSYLLKNYYTEIDLISFVLMPNHFHLLVRQQKERSIEGFMRSLLIRYTSYFNKNHKRVGHVFQGVYKGKLVERDEYLIWLSRYIHKNPKGILLPDQSLSDYPYSSYSTFIGGPVIKWINPENILNQTKNYQEFVEKEDENKPENFDNLTFEEEEDS